eukprot:COSAG01_NODE_2597_length_7400_cov_37.453363_6_plen_150_part_00
MWCEPRGTASAVVICCCAVHVVSRAADASALTPITSPLPKACYLTALRAHSTDPIAGAANGSGPGTATWLPCSLSPERFFGSLGPDQLLCKQVRAVPHWFFRGSAGYPPEGIRRIRRTPSLPTRPPRCLPPQFVRDVSGPALNHHHAGT